jgi:hypothetical protein
MLANLGRVPELRAEMARLRARIEELEAGHGDRGRR